MTAKWAALAALIALACPTVATPTITPAIANNPAVEQVVCATGLGSAVRISPGRFITAEHVSDNGFCTIEELPIAVEYSDEKLDFAIVRTISTTPHSMEIDCSGFRDGDHYFAVGYAGGYPIQRLIVVRHSALLTRLANLWGLQSLTGAMMFIPGMSGGLVGSREHKITGIVNARMPIVGTSHSRPLSETPLCSIDPGR